MDQFNAAEAAARLMALEGGQPLQDGEGPGGIAGYLDRRSGRALTGAGKDALYGVGALAAGSVLAPVTNGLSYIPAYGIAGLNFGRAASGLGNAALLGMSANRFGQMPEAPPPEEAMYSRRQR
jgi:hypothetical protein